MSIQKNYDFNHMFEMTQIAINSGISNPSYINKLEKELNNRHNRSLCWSKNENKTKF